MARKKQDKKKIDIVFDPQKRKEFLTGFRKRKNERRSRAKVELERNLKEERIRIRKEVKEGFKHLKKSFEPLRELTEEDKDEAKKEKAYEDDEVQVKIVELSTNDLTAQRNMLGANCAEESATDEDQAQSDVEDEQAKANCIPGMDFDINERKRKSAPLTDDDKVKKSSKTAEIKSKKDLDKLMKTKTLKKIKKSKLFKIKEQFDKKANQKKSRRDHNNTLKNVPKSQRKKLKYGQPQPSRYRKGRMINKKELRRKRNAD
ncbi:ribosomal RNA-processing protein 17 [Scaptodrosophila lebanonensis]|uniref:Nucleolar protein 12 n=1 Tax=Drosophila lebanonensis TaxID=7225 RepID=A0A6J2TW18_DROLE|nr:ribosomal RNA-processing protein 17 [Scaptodrosophila lebanonensis]